MAKGLRDSWGRETQFDPNRQVEQDGLNQRRAAQFHYQQGRSAEQVLSMSPEEWASTHEFWDNSFVPDQNEVAQLMRAYEHYSV